MKSDFDYCLKHTLAIEGDYSDDPDDSGGKTKFGITEKVARENGYKDDMEKLPIDFAKKIYKKKYWDVLELDKIESRELCKELFDSSVNVGHTRAARWFQRCLNVLNNRGKRWDDLKIDFVVGEKTVAAANIACSNLRWENRLVVALDSLQVAFYIELCERREKDEKFIGGQIDKRALRALQMRGG